MTQGELEKLALKTGKLFSELELRIMSDIARRIRENGFSTASADWQMTRLQQLGMAESEIKGWIKETLQKTDAEMDYIFSDEAYREYYQHGRAYRLSGKKQIPFEQNKPLTQLTQAVKKQLSGEYENLAASMGFAIRGADGRIQYSPLMEFYRSTLDNAVLDIQSGAFSYNTVLQRAVSRMTASGVRYVDYDSGVHNRIDVAARRAVLTGFRQVQALINEQTAADLGTDSYEVSYHVGARPSHQPWQGRVWTKEELVSVCGLGDVAGLCGANCYHDYLPFIPGVSVRTYTDEQLREMIEEENTPKEYGGKQYTTYEALQEQRKRERELRATRQQVTLLQEGGADEQEIILKKAKYQVQLRNYEDFSKKMGLPEQKARITQDGLNSKFKPEQIKKSRETKEDKERKELLSRTYKQLSLEEFKNMHHTISKEERKIIYGKTHFSGYINSSNARKINGLLRNGDPLPADFQEITKVLSEVIQKNSMPEDIVAVRYVNQDALKYISGIEFPKMLGLLATKSDIEQYWKDIEEIPHKIKQNYEYIEKGFLSTSGVSSKNVFTDRSIQLNIKVPKGTKAYVTTNYKESEIIFDRNSKLEITSAKIENNRTANVKVVLECIIR